MRPLVKPLVAVVALSLATTSAYAAMGAKTKSASKASSCGPVLDTKMDRVMNVNSPTREVLSCWTDRFALGGDATLAYVNGDAYSDGTSSSFFNVRAVNLYTDVAVAKGIHFHMMLNTDSTYVDNQPQSGTALATGLEVEEAYVTFSDFSKSPVFVKAGKSYLPFGNYDDTYPVVYSLNQALVEAQATSVGVGFASNSGYDMQLFVFENEQDDNWNELGFRLGYAGEVMGAMKGMGFKFNLSYVNDVSALNGGDSFTQSTNMNLDTAAYNVEVGFKLKNVDLGIEYFRTKDAANGTLTPKVGSFRAAYNMLMGDKKADLHLGYEKANDANGITTNTTATEGSAYATSIPEKHLNVGMDYLFDKNAKFSLNYDKFEPYAAQTGLSDQKQVSAAIKVSF